MASAQQIEYNYKTLLRDELNFNDNLLLDRLSLVNTPLREKCQQYKVIFMRYITYMHDVALHTKCNIIFYTQFGHMLG